MRNTRMAVIMVKFLIRWICGASSTNSPKLFYLNFAHHSHFLAITLGFIFGFLGSPTLFIACVYHLFLKMWPAFCQLLIWLQCGDGYMLLCVYTKYKYFLYSSSYWCSETTIFTVCSWAVCRLLVMQYT